MDHPSEISVRRLIARPSLRACGMGLLSCIAIATALPLAAATKHVKVEEKSKRAETKEKKSKSGGAAKAKSSRKSSSDSKAAKRDRSVSPPKKSPDAGERKTGKVELPRPAPAQPRPYRAPINLLSVQAPLVERPSTTDEGPRRIDYARLDARFERLARAAGMTGMGVAIVERGKLTFVKGYGVTEAGGREPVTVHTVFRWASLSKTVTATMIAKLADQGRLSLSDPIDKFDTTLRLPFDREKTATVEELLSHQLGLPRNAYDDRLERGEDPKLIRRSLALLKPVCALGACFSYQNVAFDAASEIVLRATGRSFAAAVEENLFAPLGMRDTTLGRPGLVDARSWAQPTVGGRTMRVDEPYYRVAAAGGVNSSILDLGVWLRAQMGGTGTILPRRVLDVVQAPRVSTVGASRGTEYDREMRGNSYALGWRNAYYSGHRLVGHRGAVRGYRSLILFDPVVGTGVAVLWNSQSIRPVGIPLELFDMIYGRPRRDWLKLDGAGAPAGDLPADDRGG